MRTSMELNLSNENGYVLAEMRGVINEAGEQLIRDQLHPMVRKRGTKLVLDLSHATRIDSRGISYLVRLVSDANTQDCRVILAAATPFVASVLQVTKLDRFFEMVDSVPKALEKIGVSG